MFIVLRILLILTHFICDLFAAVYNCYTSLYRKSTKIWYGENLRTESEMLITTANKKKKLPRHIVIVFGTMENTIFDCIRIIGWCITLGIPYISFFDINGFLVKNESSLKYELAKRRPDLMDHISWNKPNVKSTRNGITDSKLKTRVFLLSSSDGKGEIVTLTKKLAEAVVTGTIKSEEINIDLLDEKLNVWRIPDPDLGIIYGHVCCTYGALPWQTRITEFFTLPLHFCLSVKDFICLLEKYSKCEQRYGK
ncbi:dehydrodolichyl diphosphate synthase complex subunit Nus1 [Osmia bicornis bicornis]|uniref:dehydrodolichyl diphosphate synthase complex subunit Nus1 n=1 Tax=Osmia bicornis bicornis TaxID=1437191 RepID=UPI0010F45351|nr:dehydrodolichyl diphosphate synthase complex subunit Nus1 [Osmia bicornis bicornis]